MSVSAAESSIEEKKQTDNSLLTTNFPTLEKIQKDLDLNGYVIYENAINHEVFSKIKKYWINRFREQLSQTLTRSALRGNLRLGEPNFKFAQRAAIPKVSPWDIMTGKTM